MPRGILSGRAVIMAMRPDDNGGSRSSGCGLSASRRTRDGRNDLSARGQAAKAIRADLEAIGVPYETAEGVADFHSLRASYVSALVRSGARFAQVQRLSRHAQPETTLQHYAKVAQHDLRGVVEAIPVPAPPAPEPEFLAATGTDGRLSHHLESGGSPALPDDAGKTGVEDPSLSECLSH